MQVFPGLHGYHGPEDFESLSAEFRLYPSVQKARDNYEQLKSDDQLHPPATAVTGLGDAAATQTGTDGLAPLPWCRGNTEPFSTFTRYAVRISNVVLIMMSTLTDCGSPMSDIVPVIRTMTDGLLKALSPA